MMLMAVYLETEVDTIKLEVTTNRGDGELDMGIMKKLSRMTLSDSNRQTGGEMEYTGEGQAPLIPTYPTHRHRLAECKGQCSGWSLGTAEGTDQGARGYKL